MKSAGCCRPRPLSRTARQALGYKEAIDAFEGRLPFEEAVARIQVRTRQFAKRQHTWFRHLEECRPIEISGEESPGELAIRVLNQPVGPDPKPQGGEIVKPRSERSEAWVPGRSTHRKSPERAR